MIPIQPWMIKAGAGTVFLSLIFYSGCVVQRKHDAAKIQRLNANYDRCVGIVDTFQDNVDTLEKSIDDQNKAIDDLGEESSRKAAEMKVWYAAAIKNYDKANNKIIKDARDEAARLRERLSKLSVAEACHQAWVELTK